MKKALFSVLVIMVAAIVGISLVANSDSAVGAKKQQQECVNTSILGGGQVCDSGDGESVKKQIWTVVDIMSIGVGILGTIGITIVGIQYLTAGGSEEKTRKAKRRLFEIIIGLVAYALVYAFLKWLLPGFKTK